MPITQYQTFIPGTYREPETLYFQVFLFIIKKNDNLLMYNRDKTLI